MIDTLIPWFSSLNFLNNSIWVVFKICFGFYSYWFHAILRHITSISFGKTRKYFIQYSHIIFLTFSPSLSLYGCLQMPFQQAHSSFSSIYNLNFLWLCNFFRGVPNSFAIDFIKRFSWLVDETTAVCISLHASRSLFFKIFHWF